MKVKQNPLKSCECFNGKIKGFSCNFNRLFMVFHVENPMKRALKFP